MRSTRPIRKPGLHRLHVRQRVRRPASSLTGGAPSGRHQSRWHADRSLHRATDAVHAGTQPAQHLRGQDGTVPPFMDTHTTGGPRTSPETAPGQIPPRPARAGRSQRDNDHRDRTVNGHRIRDPHVIIGAGMTHLGRSAVPIAATDPNLPTPRCHAASAAGTEFRAEPREMRSFRPNGPGTRPATGSVLTPRIARARPARHMLPAPPRAR